MLLEKNVIKTLHRIASSLEEGRLDRAEELCNEVLLVRPDHADGWHLLGLVSYHRGDYELAVENISKAIGYLDNNPIYYLNLGLSLLGLKEFIKAEEAFRKVTELKFDWTAGWSNLGDALFYQKRLHEAEEAYRQATSCDQYNIHAINNLGLVLQNLGKNDEAIKILEKSLSLVGNQANIHYNLGVLYEGIDEDDKAIERYREAIRLDAQYSDAYCNLALKLSRSGEVEEARMLFEKSLQLDPELAESLVGLAVLYSSLGDSEKAEEYAKLASELNPNDEKIQGNEPYLYCLWPGKSQEDIFNVHKQWGERHSNVDILQNSFDKTADKTLRIGYISPDFRSHVIVNFITLILAHHNHGDVQAYCYANVKNPDEKTELLKTLAYKWRDIWDIPNRRVAEMIQEDKIDILVDLAGHTADTRLKVLAYKPAPVQISYLGYPNTTGLSAVDYRLGDEVADLPENDCWYTEEIIHLPDHFLCYNPPRKMGEVVNVPAKEKGYITLGSLNNVRKINDDVIDLWSEVLRKIPGSRLLLKSHFFQGESGKNSFIERFARKGIDRERLDLRPYLPNMHDHFAIYNEIDIALDTFPYNGTTTTFEALWMGVPLVTFFGDAHVSRVSSSILLALQLEELIAETKDDYCSLVVALANDIDKLSVLRHNLRQKLLDSPMCDGKAFTRNLEKTYRQLWLRWCAT